MSLVCTVVELRQYALHTGRRDELIDLFEREFVETQEAAGMTLIGQFRDLDRPDHFVWLRGFPAMEARRHALEAFYSGPAWQAHRSAANATMIDSNNVLLLRPLDEASGFTVGERPPEGDSGPGPGILVAGVHALSGRDDALPVSFRERLAGRLAAAGLVPTTVLMTESAANTFPRLPVRVGERVLVWLAVAADLGAADAAITRARADPHLSGPLARSLQLLRLQPTARSRLHS